MSTHLTVEGQRLPIEEWAADYGIPVALIRSRLRRGWSTERAVTEPMYARRGEKLAPDAMVDLKPAPRPTVGMPYAPPIPSTIIVEPQPRTWSPRPARIVEHEGQSRTMGEWAARLGITKQALAARLASNPATAFRPAHTKTNGRRITFNGCTLTISEWAERTGLNYVSLYRRLEKGWPLEEALDPTRRRQTHPRSIKFDDPTGGGGSALGHP